MVYDKDKPERILTTEKSGQPADKYYLIWTL